jgi:hypothetical protein
MNGITGASGRRLAFKKIVTTIAAPINIQNPQGGLAQGIMRG